MRRLFISKGVFDTCGRVRRSFISKNGKLSFECEKIDEEIFLNGYVYPAFIDAHAHVIGTGFRFMTPSLLDVKNMVELMEIVEKTDFEVLRGWDEEIIGRIPSKEELNAFDRPLLLVRRCGHVGVANDLFLKKFDIRSKDGMLKESELASALQKVGNDLENIKKAVETAQKVFFSYGVTSVHSDDMYSLKPDVVERVLKDVDLDIYEHYHVHSLEELENFVKMKNVRSVKVLLDGSLGARTAYLREVYSDAPRTKGMLNFSPSEIRKIVRIADENGIQVVMHVIGDGALDVALKSFEGTDKALRHRLIHVQISHSDQIEEMKKLGLCVDVQPQFYPSDRTMALKRLGKRVEDAYKFKDIIENGISTAFSSDSPVEIPDPLRGIKAAKELGIELWQSLRSYTFEGAYHEFSEKKKGCFKAGMKADFIVFDRRLENDNAILLETYKNGRLVWKREKI